MNVIDRYVVGRFLSGYLILLVVGIGMFVLFDLSINLDEYTEDRRMTAAQILPRVFDYYYHNLPLYYSQLSGAALAISAAFTLGMMLRNNELTALVASGTPLQRLIAPLVVCTLVLIGIWTLNRELLIPSWAHKIARTHDDAVGRQTTGVYCARDPSGNVLTALRSFPDGGRLENVLIFVPQPGDAPQTLIEADHAEYDAAARTWRLGRGRAIRLAGAFGAGTLQGEIRYEPISEFAFGLAPGDLLLRQSAEWADLLSLTQLNEMLAAGRMPNRATIEMSRHIRLTTWLLQITAVLLAAPAFLSCAPVNVFSAGGQSLAWLVAFFLTSFISHGAVREESWALLAAWIPILIFAPLAVFRLGNVRT